MTCHSTSRPRSASRGTPERRSSETPPPYGVAFRCRIRAPRSFSASRSSASRMWIGTTLRYEVSERSPTSTVWSRVVADVDVPRSAHLVPQRLGGLDSRRAECRKERRQQRRCVDDEEDESERPPGDDQIDIRRALAVRGRVDHVVGEDQRQAGADEDRRQRDERRLEQEGRLHHPALEADRAQHADLLAPLDDRAGADHAESRDADDEAEAHEARGSGG